MPSLMEMLRLQNLFGAPQITAPGIAGGDFAPPQDFSQGFGPKTDPYNNISFGPPAQSAAPAQTPMAPVQSQPTGGFDVGARMRELYQPETMANDRFNTMLGEYPEAQKPGWLKVIGATLADMARPGSGMGVIEGNRGRELADWKNKIGSAQDAASLERQTNLGERQLATSTVTQERLAANDAERAEKDRARTKIMQDRAEVYRLKSTQKDFKFDFSGPKVKVMNPTTGEVQVTDIDTGSMSDADKMALQQDNALEMEEVRQGGRKELEEQRQTGREGLAETRGWGQPVEISDPNDNSKRIAVSINQATGEVKRITLDDKAVSGITKPGTNKGLSGMTPQQKKVDEFNRARQLAATDPELGKFITMKGNDFQIKSSTSWSGPSAEQRKRINDAIFGEGGIPMMQPGRTGATPTQQQAPQAPPGWKYVPKSGGGWTAVQDNSARK